VLNSKAAPGDYRNHGDGPSEIWTVNKPEAILPHIYILEPQDWETSWPRRTGLSRAPLRR